MFSRLLRFVRDEWERLWFGAPADIQSLRRPDIPPEPCMLCNDKPCWMPTQHDANRWSVPCPLCGVHRGEPMNV